MAPRRVGGGVKRTCLKEQEPLVLPCAQGQAHHSNVFLAYNLASGKRYPLLSQVGSLLLLSSSTCQEQALGRNKEPRAGAAENGSQSCLWAALGGETVGTFLSLEAGSLAVLCSTLTHTLPNSNRLQKEGMSPQIQAMAWTCTSIS